MLGIRGGSYRARGAKRVRDFSVRNQSHSVQERQELGGNRKREAFGLGFPKRKKGRSVSMLQVYWQNIFREQYHKETQRKTHEAPGLGGGNQLGRKEWGSLKRVAAASERRYLGKVKGKGEYAMRMLCGRRRGKALPVYPCALQKKSPIVSQKE